MTNAEHLEHLLHEKNYKEFMEYCQTKCGKYSKYPRKCVEGKSCEDCNSDWLNGKYNEPMPKLETGMIIKVDYEFLKEQEGRDFDYGVIVGNDVFYQDGGHDDTRTIQDDTNIVSIYKAKCFNEIGQGRAKLIWSRED